MFDQADGVEVALDVSPSPRLQADLMKHQLQALGLMIERESSRLESLKSPSLWIPVSNETTGPGLYRHAITGAVSRQPQVTSGGIIADEMGLGKTLSMLALICSHLDSLGISNTEGQQSRTTLIVTPKSTLYGWQRQIKRHICDGQITSLVYHGSRKQKLSSEFDNVDIVLTTYETLRSEHILEGPLLSQHWLRLVLDEAHHIRNRESQVFAACCKVRAQYRWCLTGTPVQNSLDDYGALLSFLGVYPFQDKKVFDRWIAGPFKKSTPHAIENLRRLVAATCLRRTKAKCNLSTPLPQRYEEIEKINLLPKDQEIYDFFKQKIQKVVNPNFQDHNSPRTKQSKRPNILSLITLLRVICDHAELLPQTAISAWKTGNANISEKDTKLLLTEVNGEYGEDVESMRSESPVLGLGNNEPGRGAAQSVNPKFISQRLQVYSVVFSSWTRMLDKVEEALRAEGFNCQRIDGQSSLKSRGDAMRIFSEDKNCTVMLASIGSAGEGVDFTAAQYVHILEPHWNPMAEAQAIDRVHRIGQKLPVTITRYIVPRSVESYVQWVQSDKLRIINLSLDTIENAADVEKKRWEKLKTFLR
ncbi:hypothetical protein F4803DRAFT_575585 [Xylaria telfairii]|nr:hypothetical protein F4803DRAFT_575585 [Xylaria telfairii]